MEVIARKVKEGDKRVNDRVLEDLLLGTCSKGSLGGCEVGKGPMENTEAYENA